MTTKSKSEAVGPSASSPDSVAVPTASGREALADDEVRAWLGSHEWEYVWVDAVNDPGVRAALRSLAETRRALYACTQGMRGVFEPPWCLVCDSPPHDPDCLVATMPRPK